MRSDFLNTRGSNLLELSIGFLGFCSIGNHRRMSAKNVSRIGLARILPRGTMHALMALA